MSDIPEPIKLYNEKKATIEKTLYSHDLVVKEAYLAGAKTFRDDNGFYDPEKIKDPKAIDKANAAMIDIFKEAAKKQYGFDADTFQYKDRNLNGNTEADNIDFVLKMYTGLNVTDHKHKMKQALETDPLGFKETTYTNEVMTDERGINHRQKLAHSLRDYATSHLSDEHIHSIFDFVHERSNLEGIIEKDGLDLDGAKILLELDYETRDKGQLLTKDIIKGSFAQHFPTLPNYINRNGHQKAADINEDLKEMVEEYAGIREPEAQPEPTEEEIIEMNINHFEHELESGNMNLGQLQNFYNQAMASGDEKQMKIVNGLIARLQEKGVIPRPEEQAPPEEHPQESPESNSEEENTEEEVPQE